MSLKYYFILCCSLLVLAACEEVIDIDLNAADPRVVIEAQLSDLNSVQRIRVSKSVAFSESINSLPVENALVTVRDDQGRNFSFQYEQNGNYIHPNFKPVAGRTYVLHVYVGDELYESSCIMPAYVDVDSIGVLEENIFGDPYYFATFKFNDPADVNNYYKYDLSINGAPYRFASALNDKFNDGLYVTHQISDLDTDLVVGDSINVRRYCVDRKVYEYWNEFQSTNPGTAAPGNPTSNISNNALGYFSVASAKEFGLRIEEGGFIEE
ncbi:DUF4249 domain-containing protein [Sphingobacterium suaedae]|uniref:DUF4249 domain-containing protein n=1 Tax=Sphingobacterium suaedae TaxID=1686402 RepID=A0ABW5KDI3_9SPHI